MKKKILILDDYKPIKKIFIKFKKFKLIFKTFKNQNELDRYLKKNFFSQYIQVLDICWVVVI